MKMMLITHWCIVVAKRIPRHLNVASFLNRQFSVFKIDVHLKFFLFEK